MQNVEYKKKIYKKKQVLNRVYLVSRQREGFYLRLVLLYVSGVTSFEFLKTVEYVIGLDKK